MRIPVRHLFNVIVGFFNLSTDYIPLPTANPRSVAHGAFFVPKPFLGGFGIKPAWPKRRATVSLGCAPTESQYFALSIFKPMCLLPSISVQWAMMGWEVGGQRNGERAPNGSTPAVGMGRLRVKRKKERRRTWLGVVVPDDLDVPSVSRGFAVRDVYSIERQVAVPVPRQANAHRHAGLGLVRAGVAHDGRVIRVQRVMMRMRKSNGAVFSCSLATYVFVTPPTSSKNRDPKENIKNPSSSQHLLPPRPGLRRRRT